MTPDPATATAAAPIPERSQAVWPWLLLPFVALTMFFLLKTAKDSLPPPSEPHHADAPADPAPSELSDSH